MKQQNLYEDSIKNIEAMFLTWLQSRYEEKTVAVIDNETDQTYSIKKIKVLVAKEQ